VKEIAFSNISKTYDPGLFKKKVRAVEHLSLEIEKGEIFGLIGPNGAGKSTSIRLLLGLTRPDSGKIFFRGKQLKEVELQTEIGYLPENPYLYDYLTLREILRFCGRTSGLPSSEISHRSQYLMKKLDLAEVQKRPLRTFSKGMLQRAGICFALLHDPAVVILDEPMSGLDPNGRKMVFDLVMELKEMGKTVFFCSHILSDVERLCDRIGLMVRGRLVNVYDRKDFALNSNSLVHLVVSPLSEDHRRKIEPLLSGIYEGRGEQVLSFQPSMFHKVSQTLSELNIEIRSTRSENFSLEELFLKVFEEQKA
jgi:ABC-2 type transport system ATP-binding protein